ncbi:MAG: NAD(P)-dependent glycerol-3-phosphate dehydrogenase [Alphaproteobacteria bacterium]|nr:NAD(P)-dependent glycerol-3-phosphate dehydrogenase [Alphaproteobacteria bacterium]
MNRIAVIGAGAWGTALAAVARRAGREVRLWAREPEVVAAINERHENPVYLAGITLDPEIVATNKLEDAVDGAEAVLLVTPAQHSRAVAVELAAHVPPSVPTLICSKGIEEGTGKLMSEVLAQLAPGRAVGVLSGPTFAGEVARGLPTAITLAADAEGLGRTLVKALGSATFRPYWSPDVIGAQIGGAVKNVLAIACGIVEGRKLGDNARAALITRGLAEIVRLGLAKGARTETLFGLSGLGDLALTCTGPQSRNMSLGMALGAGETLEAILGKRNTVAEGVYTAASVTALASRLDVEMPIASAVNAILHQGAAIDEVVAGLLARPFKAEGDLG